MEVEKQINQMLENDVIEESTSPYNFPIIVVPKPNGEKRTYLRRFSTVKQNYGRH